MAFLIESANPEGENSLPFCCQLCQAHQERLINNAIRNTGAHGVGVVLLPFDCSLKKGINAEQQKE